MTITTRRITAALAGPAVAAAIFAGGATVAATPASAQPAGNTCVAPKSVAASAAVASGRLTRAGQVNLAQPRAQAQSAPTSCIGH